MRDCRGATLVELMVGMAVGMVAVGSVYAVYTTQLRGHRHHQAVLQVQQNLRAAVLILEQQIRMAGYDPEGSGQFGITDVRRYDLVTTRLDREGQPVFFFTLDLDEDGVPDPRNGFRNREHCNFRIRHEPDGVRWFLAWDNGAGRHPVAENIQAMGLAYAVDADGDGRPDTWQGGPHLIWAVDSTNDNMLDSHLDINNDGVIDKYDFSEGSLRTTAESGAALDPPVSVRHIRAVRVWLLAVSDRPVKGHADNGIYVVGDQLIQGNGDGHIRRVLETIVECRNM